MLLPFRKETTLVGFFFLNCVWPQKVHLVFFFFLAAVLIITTIARHKVKEKKFPSRVS